MNLDTFTSEVEEWLADEYHAVIKPHSKKEESYLKSLDNPKIELI